MSARLLKLASQIDMPFEERVILMLLADRATDQGAGVFSEEVLEEELMAVAAILSRDGIKPLDDRIDAGRIDRVVDALRASGGPPFPQAFP